MRVNIEDDLHLSGRLAALSRSLGVSEETALGRLYWAYRETQHRELCIVDHASFADAVAVRIDDPAAMLQAMIKARLVSAVDGGWLIHGNDHHINRLGSYRHRGQKGGLAKANNKLATAKQQPSNSNDNAPQSVATAKHGLSLLAPSSLSPKKDPDLSEPRSSPASTTEDDPRSLLPSDAKNSVGLTPSPSALVVQKKAKRKERSEEQKARSLANNRRYRELYEFAEGYAPTGLDQSFNGMMAKFSDKYCDDARAILEWAFSTPDRSFGNKGWRLDYIFDQAPRLWREINNPRAAVEHLAAPRQQHQVALAASNDLAFDEYQRRKAERLANAKPV